MAMRQKMVNEISLLAEHQMRAFFRAWTVRLWISIAVLMLLTLSFGLRAHHFENGVIWEIFGRELGPLVPRMLFTFINALLTLAVMLFFPIELASSVHQFVDRPFVNFFLARPVSRTNLLVGQIAGTVAAYAIVIVALLLAFFVLLGSKSSAWNATPFILSMFYLPLGAALHTLLILLIIITRSIGPALLGFLGYTFILSRWLEYRLDGSLWWKKLANGILDVLAHVLPPVAAASKFNQPFSSLSDSHSSQLSALAEPILVCLLSTFVLAAIASYLYQKMDL